MESYISLLFLLVVSIVSLLALEEITKGTHHSERAADYTLGSAFIAFVGLISAVTYMLNKGHDSVMSRRTVGVISVMSCLASAVFSLLAWLRLREGDDESDNGTAKTYLMVVFIIGFSLITMFSVLPVLRYSSRKFKASYKSDKPSVRYVPDNIGRNGLFSDEDF